MQIWEYLKIDRGMTQDELNLMGRDGWELISVQPGFLCFIFKRPLA
jgi:hypothetical protein